MNRKILIHETTERPWHQVLGISPDADFEEVRSAFNELWHTHRSEITGDHPGWYEIVRAYRAGFNANLARIHKCR